MYEQKQIILDGEILGNSVVVNRYFNLIYDISPVIIKNFIKIINDSSILPKPVRIKKYDFEQNNCINIYFTSKNAVGYVQIAYVINKYNELFPDTYTLAITGGENNGYLKTIETPKKSIKIDNNLEKQSCFNHLKKEPVEILNSNKQEYLSVEDFSKQIFEENVKTEDVVSIDEQMPVNDCNTKIEENIKDENPLIDYVEEHSEANKALMEKIENVSTEKDLIQETNKKVAIEKDVVVENKFEREENIGLNKVVEKEVLVQIVRKEEVLIPNTYQEEIVKELSSVEEVSLDNYKFEQNISEQENIINENIEINEIDEECTYNNSGDIVDQEEEFEQLDYVNNSSVDAAVDNDLESFVSAESITDNEKVFNDKANLENKLNEEKFMEEQNQYFDFEENNFTYNFPINSDLVSVFDIISNTLDDCKDEDSVELFQELENDSFIDLKNENCIDKEDSVEKEVEKKQGLNRAEKFALYQKILKGYDNKMTEKKLNSLKENIKLMHNEEILTTDDILDAQVELLVDNNSKAFRVIDSETIQDVIQLNQELFLSKDKIYTWGDVYLLD